MFTSGNRRGYTSQTPGIIKLILEKTFLTLFLFATEEEGHRNSEESWNKERGYTKLELPLNLTSDTLLCRVDCNCYLPSMADPYHHHTRVSFSPYISVLTASCQHLPFFALGLPLALNSSALLLPHTNMRPQMPRNKCLPTRAAFDQ